MFYALFFALLTISLAAAIILTKKDEKALDKTLSVLTISFLCLTFLNVFLPDGFVINQTEDALIGMDEGFQAMLRWLNYVCFTVLPIAVFQKNKYFLKLAYYFCLPIALMNVLYFNKYLPFFTSEMGRALYAIRFSSEGFKAFLTNEVFRGIFFGAICLCQLLALILLAYRRFPELGIKKDEIKNLLLIGLGVIYMSLPIFTPQYLFGYTDIILSRFSVSHIAWMLGIVLMIVALWLIFRKRSYEARYLLVLAMSYALLMQFSQMFSSCAEINVFKFPLQLCNLGSYFALLMVLTRSEKLFHFALIVNVVGAVIAIIILDVNNVGLFQLWNVHYIVEHTKVLVVPILCLILRIYKPIEKKHLKHFAIGFVIYFVSVWLIGTISNGLYRMLDNSYFYTNFLFMFDKATANKLVGFTDPLFDIKIALGSFEIYPVVQLLVFAVFMIICIGVFFLIYALTAKRRREEKKES